MGFADEDAGIAETIRANRGGCGVQFSANGLAETKRYLEMGIDTILTNGYQPIIAATGLC